MARKSVHLTSPEGAQVEVDSPTAVNDLVYGHGYSVPKSTTVEKVLAELKAPEDDAPAAAEKAATVTK